MSQYERGFEAFFGHFRAISGPFWPFSGHFLNAHKWLKIGPEIVRKWSVNGPEIFRKWSRNGPKMTRKWS